jgi:uncharacterized protein YcgI (DUF1989 family)
MPGPDWFIVGSAFGKDASMKSTTPEYPAPPDAGDRSRKPAIVCYPPETLPAVDLAGLRARREVARHIETATVEPREAACVQVRAGAFFRIVSTEGPQVGDLNLWAADNFCERFYSGKTRALHGTHVSTGDRLWSSLPHLRPMATIIADTLDWYGFDGDGGSVHDVIGTRCDPYTNRLLSGSDYHNCCHSNLTRAFADHAGLPVKEAELYVHDVMNVFMCTGFLRDTHQYFMKASPVRPGDYLELYADIDLVVGLSACPGGDCGSEHSSDTARCYPLLIEIYADDNALAGNSDLANKSSYDRSHGR